MGYSPSPLFGNSKNVFGGVSGETKGFERERGDAQESRSVISYGMRSENVPENGFGGNSRMLFIISPYKTTCIHLV
jgi:hypothetical protein